MEKIQEIYHLFVHHSTYDLQVKCEERYAWKCKTYEYICLKLKPWYENEEH